MNIDEIKYWALRFRTGVETAHKNRLFKSQPFNDFPNACCGDAPELLAQYLIDNDLNQKINCRIVYGTYRYDDFDNFFGHSWLVVNEGIIVDITADQRQFKDKNIFPQNAIQPCFVETNSEFHSMFEIVPVQCREFYGLRNLGDYAYKRMKELYDIILSCIDENESY